MKLTSFDGSECVGVAWSPDGERIVLDVDTRDESAIYIIGASGGVASKIIDDGDSSSWSREGNWIHFSSKRTGMRQIWKAKLTSGSVSGMTQVTKNGGSRLQESADGKFIYYSRDDAAWRVPSDGGAEVRIVGPLCDRENFVVARSGIYFMLPQDKKGRWLIQRLNLADGKLKTVVVVEGTVEWGMTVSPDEQWLLYAHLDDAAADLMLVENFR